MLSGSTWVSQFPTSRSLDDLAEPFRTNATRFIAALRNANATVTIGDTLRQAQRAYLMHYCFAIARQGLDPASVQPMDGIDIQWEHVTAGVADLAQSVAAAEQMVQAYRIVFGPVLKSRHTEGNAVDMDIVWNGNLLIADAHGNQQTISSVPRTGSANSDLHQIGASYGVIKLLTDPPHWSCDGH